MVLRNLFFINAILLDDSSPEQLDTIIDVYMRIAISTFGKMDWRCSVSSNMAKEDGVWHPRDLANSMNCIISSPNSPDWQVARNVT